MEAPNLRIVLYSRISQADQSRYSLGSQAETCRAFAARQGYTVVSEWQDAMSGKDPGRPGYQAMLAARETWDAVIVWRLDRLGRDEAEYFVTIAALRRLGKQVLSATEPNGSAVVSGILAVLAAEESRRIAERVKPNMLARLSQGKAVSMLPWGMRADRDGHPEPDPDPACRAVDLAYWGYDPEGGRMDLRELGRWLEAQGYRAPKGGHWRQSTLYHVLASPLYAGDLAWGGTVLRDNHAGRVSREQVERVRVRLASRQNNRASPQERPGTLGAGLVYCGECGAKLQHATGSGWQRRYGHWRCPTRAFLGSCPNTGISDLALLAALETEFAGLRLAPEQVESAISAVRALAATESVATERDQAEREVVRLAAAKDRLLDDRQAGLLTQAELSERLPRARRELAEADARVAELRGRSGADTEAHLLRAVAWLRQLAEGGVPPAVLAVLLPEVVERVTLYTGRRVALTWRTEAGVLLRR